MSQADVQSLVALISNGQYDPTLFGEFFDDVMAQLGSGDWHTTAVPITFTAGQPTVQLPTTLLNLITVIYDKTVLSELTLRELEALTTGWRNWPGAPLAYTTETETSKSIAVAPVPAQTSPMIIPVHGLPTGRDYQPGNGISIHSELRQDPLDYLTLPIALRILEREYDRESDHQDFAFSMACKQLSDTLFGMLK
jgi:hypothetical protein